MDIIELHRNLHKKNILEKYSLPYDFFTTPCKLYDKETCLHEILYLLIHNKIIFETDSSYLQYFIPKSKGTFSDYPFLEITSNNFTIPYLDKDVKDKFIILLCFIRSFSSHTYDNKYSFVEHFKRTFLRFYHFKH